jgi:UTP:GlnB (protein PII) uridylyltransferase
MTASMEEVMKGSDQGMPVVLIDNTADPLATVVTVSFGEVLGQLLDTCESLRRLGLNINRAEVTEGSPANTFYITDAATSEKITKSDVIESIRMTIINNMLTYHPEAADFLVEGQRVDIPGDHEADEAPLGARKPAKVPTRVTVEKVKGGKSKVVVETTDRPGLLVDVVRTLKDLSLNVVSAEIDTVGPKAYDVIYCTYKGEALNKSMHELVVNALMYYLTRREIESNESY